MQSKITANLNALKHGILSRQSVVRTDDYEEDEKLYQSLKKALFDDAQPEGMVETMPSRVALQIFFYRVESTLVDLLEAGSHVHYFLEQM